jgi:DNA-binding phage protein
MHEANAMNEKHLGSTLDDFLAEEGRLDEAEALAAERVQRYQATSRYAPFDAADYLDDEETIAEYLAAALEDPNPDALRAAMQDVVRARARDRDVASAEALQTMLASEAVLQRDWDRPEEDGAWADL